ncbi:3-oxoacyl-[acyl-carrier-protein] synthase 2 [Stieleria maiorica]|uniref:3-oxoacyl-[acyl-carrier-protein] synthase 2 n=1 Tax=Stieleria maiorica TaxID=2795974 RepID=A0A5B9M7D9_9BACT|nr:beta-ketoacyl synthase N-terminal-like domain-containing protein [Stieleria maiorica]QEF97118.1 3-oxoacyl-[acyl-carrier-protein] synthase 2 [Stieleria maiorica]
MPRETVVITGVGIVSAIGIGQQDYFDALLEGRTAVRSLADRTDGEAKPAPDETIDGVWIGAPIIDFQAKQYVKPRKALKVMCREIQTAFASAQLAIEHAGLADSIPASDSGAVPPERLGAVFGSEIFFNPPDELADAMRGCIDESGQFHPERFGVSAQREVMPLWMLKYLPNMPACQVGISINSQGPNNSLVLGDVSGPAALLEAESYLNRGIADVVLVGATGTRIGSTRMLYHRDLPVPERGDLPIEDLSRPHDPDAPGVVGGEGAGSLVVETRRHAEQRGANILATVLAAASRFSPTAAIRSGYREPEPNTPHSRQASTAIQMAIQAVLQQSGLTSDQIGLVVSHAIGDRQVDAGEATALAESGVTCPVVAVSAALGHTGAASGVIELATGALSLAKKTIPPTRHGGTHPGITFAEAPEPLKSPYVLCLSHTTDGSAMAVLLG